MTDIFIPFEIHITTSPIPPGEVDKLVELCILQQAKPLLIELARGEHMSQPMFTKTVYFKTFEEALHASNNYSTLLEINNFNVNRLKIEIPTEYAGLFAEQPTSTYTRYYEWHGKIDYKQKEQLSGLCSQHKVHLSKNALRDEAEKRFITLREFGMKQIFDERVRLLTESLKLGNWKIFKHISEYCIFDSNCFLDNGWLPQ